MSTEKEYLAKGEVCIRVSEFIVAESEKKAEELFRQKVSNIVSYPGLTDSIEISGVKIKETEDQDGIR